MSKIIIPTDMKKLLEGEASFLSRNSIRIFPADSSEEVLAIHRSEQVELIAVQLRRSGLSTEQLCGEIRQDQYLRAVSILIVCANIASEIRAAQQCSSNGIITRPIQMELLLDAFRQLLTIPERKQFRVLLSVSVTGVHGVTQFFCRSENISVSGILIETDKALAVGDRIECSFFLPGGVRVQAIAEVVRASAQSRGFGAWQYGLRFIELSPDYKRALDEYIWTSK